MTVKKQARVADKLKVLFLLPEWEKDPQFRPRQFAVRLRITVSLWKLKELLFFKVTLYVIIYCSVDDTIARGDL